MPDMTATKTNSSLCRHVKLNALKVLLCGALHIACQPDCLAESVEFEIPKTGAFLPLKAESNGTEFYCTLDTGSLETAVNDKSSKLYGALIQKNENDPRSITRQSQICEGVPIKIGHYTLQTGPATVLPLSGIQRELGFKFEAIIGIRQFKSTRIYVNNSGGVMSLLQELPPDLIEKWSSCEIDPKLQGTKVRLWFEGKMRSFTVSTGMTDYLNLEGPLYQEVVQSKGAAQLDEQSASKGEGTSGISVQPRAVFQKGYFMGRPLAGCPITSGAENIIGLRWLHQYDYLIDFVGLKFYYRSRLLVHPMDPWVILGMRLSFDIDKHEAVISELAPNSVLRNAGAKEGDRLVTFGLLKENEINFVTVEEEFQKYEGGKITLEILKPQSPTRQRFVLSLKNK